MQTGNEENMGIMTSEFLERKEYMLGPNPQFFLSTSSHPNGFSTPSPPLSLTATHKLATGLPTVVGVIGKGEDGEESLSECVLNTSWDLKTESSGDASNNFFPPSPYNSTSLSSHLDHQVPNISSPFDSMSQSYENSSMLS